MKKDIERLLAVLNASDDGYWSIGPAVNKAHVWCWELFWNGSPIVFEHHGTLVPGMAIYAYLLGWMGGRQG